MTTIDSELISDDFVVVEADWSVADAIDMMRAMGVDFAVVHRWEGRQQYYYVRTLDRFLDVNDVTVSVLDGLGLHEWGADPTTPVHAPVGDPNRSLVILDGASVAGVVAESPPIPQAVPRPSRQPRPTPRPRRSARRGGRPRTAAPPVAAAPDDEPVTRHLSAEHPEAGAVGEELNIFVTFGGEAVAGVPGVQLQAEVGSTVEVILSTRSGVEVVGPDSHTFDVTADGSEQVARFKVKAVDEGMASLRLMAFSGTSNVANLPMTIEVTAGPSGPRGTTTVAAELEDDQADPPDLMLLIYEALENGQPTLRFQVHGTDPGLQLNMRSFQPVTVRRNPEEYFSTYFADIEALLDPGNLSAEEIDKKLQVKGASLYEEIVPQELRDKLWEVRDAVKSVLIQSTDPWVPWEMCFLSGPDDAGFIVDHGFVCEHYDVSRWIQGQPLHRELSLAKLGLVVTGDSGLPMAIAEGDFVEELGQRSDAGVERIDSNLLALTEALAGGTFTGFHFTGHGLFTEDTDPDRTKIVLEDHKPFRAENISGRAKNLGREKPIVFLNACQAGRSGMSLADAGGWARAMVGAGAGAFIGAHWSVLDDAAGGFAKVFYERLLAGDTLAAAVRKARLSVRAPGDPTWLAYVLYADPSATVDQRFN